MITKRTLNVIFIVVGIAALLATYELYFLDNQSTCETITNECNGLKTRINDLDLLIAKEATYDEGIANFGKEIESMSGEFTQAVRNDDIIMYATGIEDTIDDFFVSAVAFSDPEEIATFTGGGLEDFSAYRTAPTLSFSSTYESAKELIDYLNKDEDTKRSIESLDLAYDNETGNMEGVVQFSIYTVSVYGSEYKESTIPSIDHGTGNIFGGIIKKDE